MLPSPEKDAPRNAESERRRLPNVMERLNAAGVRIVCDGGSRLVEARDVLAIAEALRTRPEGSPIPPIDCDCGWGGVHDPDNPRCARNGAVFPPGQGDADV